MPLRGLRAAGRRRTFAFLGRWLICSRSSRTDGSARLTGWGVSPLRAPAWAWGLSKRGLRGDLRLSLLTVSSSCKACARSVGAIPFSLQIAKPAKTLRAATDGGRQMFTGVCADSDKAFRHCQSGLRSLTAAGPAPFSGARPAAWKSEDWPQGRSIHRPSHRGGRRDARHAEEM